MDCSPPSYSVHGIIQARILEWVAIPFSRESSQCRGWTQVSCIAGRFFTFEWPGKSKHQLYTRHYSCPDICTISFRLITAISTLSHLWFSYTNKLKLTEWNPLVVQWLGLLWPGFDPSWGNQDPASWAAQSIKSKQNKKPQTRKQTKHSLKKNQSLGRKELISGHLIPERGTEVSTPWCGLLGNAGLLCVWDNSLNNSEVWNVDTLSTGACLGRGQTLGARRCDYRHPQQGERPAPSSSAEQQRGGRTLDRPHRRGPQYETRVTQETSCLPTVFLNPGQVPDLVRPLSGDGWSQRRQKSEDRRLQLPARKIYVWSEAALNITLAQKLKLLVAQKRHLLTGNLSPSSRLSRDGFLVVLISKISFPPTWLNYISCGWALLGDFSLKQFLIVAKSI